MKHILAGFLLLPFIAFSQVHQQPDAAQIRQKISKLNFLGSVLYVAAHPDDENTRIITQLANGRLATVGYLSMTRGDGGQNLIGPEIRDLLGLIRTQELLAARRIDGGQQFFTRANDFGYSRSPEETFRIWGKEEILSDVVKIFRQYRPDVIITRFPTDGGGGHGHHTASAILAGEAFDLAARSDSYPGQVKELGTWQVKRLFTNTGRWWNSQINENTPGIITIDVGGYNRLLGKSYTEISALSSSQHKSQGWGRRGERGYQPEFLELTKGEKADGDIFDGVNTTWSRVKNSGRVQTLVNGLIAGFVEEDPSLSVPSLLELRKEILQLEESVWRNRKLLETEQLIQDCLGLFIEATASHYQGSPGEGLRTTIEVVNRSPVEVTLRRITATTLDWDTLYARTLAPNTLTSIRSAPTVADSAEYSDPYWLRESHSTGRFTVPDESYIGLPENPPATEFIFDLAVGGEQIRVTRPLIYKWVDPVRGELWRPFEIVPPVFVNVNEKVIVFNTGSARPVTLSVRSSVGRPMKGNLFLELPPGWKSEPEAVPFQLSGRDEVASMAFHIYPPPGESVGEISAFAEVDGKRHRRSLDLISYEHFPIQTLLPAARVKVMRIDLRKEGNMIGYIRGAGDDTPSALRNMGYEVWEMTDEEVTAENLSRVDAVVVGIRAFNTNRNVRFFMNDLLEYVKNGGTLVVQYNTIVDVTSNRFSPFPLKISRERVTEEDAAVRILNPDHPVMTIPNRITSQDFEGWVQERGLYFPNEWDPAFEPILSMNDKDQKPSEGSLLIARYGSGHYVYTGLSFFRELPEGVPGAYRLFANLVSLRQPKKGDNGKAKSKTR